MKAIKSFSFIILLPALLLTSCSIEKRIYRSGYHVEWNSTKREAACAENATQLSPQQIVALNQAGTETSNTTPTRADDIKVSSDNTVPSAFPKATLFSSRENSAAIATTPSSEEKSTSRSETTSPKKQVEKSTSPSDSGKSQLVALLLCIFLGALGIHRFYLGYPGIAILMLFTGGLCGILALIDLIRIITGDLKPKKGDYSDKL